MPNYSKIIVVGHLTRDPEIRKAGNSELMELSIASNYKSKEYEEVFYAECVAWGKTIDIIEGKFFKGDAIMIEGRPKTETWEDKQGGKRSKVKITIERVIFLTSGTRTEREPQPPREHQPSRPGAYEREQQRSQRQTQPGRRQATPPEPSYHQEDNDDNIPF